MLTSSRRYLRRFGSGNVLLIATITFFLSALIYTVRISKRKLQPSELSQTDGSTCPRLDRLFLDFKDCNQAKLDRLSSLYGDPKEHGQHLWDEFHEMAMTCGAEYIANKLNMQVITVPRDIKAVIYPINKNDSIESVTLGIGGDITIEKEMKKNLPNIHHYGLDPFNSSAHVFHEIGKVFQVGIGRTTGERKSLVLQDKPGRVYEWETISTITLPDLLRKVDRPLIDYLFIDVEGGEYDVLPDQLAVSVTGEWTICQMCIEVHGPIERYGYKKSDFTKLVSYLFSSDSPYLPFWMPPPDVRYNFHHHFHLMNWKAKECVEKYLKKFC